VTRSRTQEQIAVERTPFSNERTEYCSGSFDCVVLRFANDNFAQDDKITKRNYRLFPSGCVGTTIGLLTGTIAPFEGSAAACARVSTSS
jgi:hypothetical protein